MHWFWVNLTLCQLSFYLHGIEKRNKVDILKYEKVTFMVTGLVMLNVLILFNIHILPFSFSACWNHFLRHLSVLMRWDSSFSNLIHMLVITVHFSLDCSISGLVTHCSLNGKIGRRGKGGRFFNISFFEAS